MTSPSVPHLSDLISRPGPHGLGITTSVLPTVPLVQAHLGIPADIAGPADLADIDVLLACWPDLPACIRFEQHGGSVDVGRRNQWLTLSLTCTSDRLPLLADVVAEVLDPLYTPARVAAAAAKAGRQATLVAAQPSADSVRQLWRSLYGHVPASADPAPSADEISAVTAERVARAHAHRLRPQEGHLVLVGDLDGEHAHALIGTVLADWQPRSPGAPPPRPRILARPAGSLHRPRPSWAHTQIRLAARTASRRSHWQFAVDQIAAHILGGSFGSRINTVLREEEGLAYRTHASLLDHLDDDLLLVEADVDSGRSDTAHAHLLRVLDDFAEHGPTDRELRSAVSHVLGKYALNLGTQAGRAACILSYLTVGFPLTAMNSLLGHLPQLTRSDVRTAAAQFRSTQLTGVICGPVRTPADTPLPHAS
ncbi:insulinase family protein [Streptomyces sp. NPDC045431]|uniref:M16 family metallopeptidase n=1 Tax=Streptomyces sp. NPDC045431 TaxID=3155613 RepID=UPI0034087698